MKLLAYDGTSEVRLTRREDGVQISAPNGTEVCICDHNAKSLRNEFAQPDDEVVVLEEVEYFVDHDDLEWLNERKYRKPLQ